MATSPAKPPLLTEFDPAKFLAELKIPAMPDVEAVLDTHKRNLSALTEANRVALEGAQAVARRHMEIMQSTMTELSETLKDLSTSTTPASRAAKHAELLKQAFETSVANSRELGDLIHKSNTEALNKLNARFSEAMSEMKTLFGKKTA
ncbi:phasin family protein [Acidocella sp.]|uniref:phasin family protein n=1 Tax=Acidocella sp. TaxID=50710 RepID=UPI002628D5FB|nr:phasin family protein [Acidocella sp.]